MKTGPRYDQTFACSDNPGQIFETKYRKIKHNKKSLISTFACFFNCYGQSLISGRDTGY